MPETTAAVVRLSVNLAPDVALVLRARAAVKGITLTEAIRRSIATWDFIEAQRLAGHAIASLEGDRYRKIHFAD
jgi:hypothetical protein